MNRIERPKPARAGTAANKHRETPGQAHGPRAKKEAPTFRPGRGAFTPSAVELHIDELVLNGFDPVHRHQVGDAIERELTRLFSEAEISSAITRGLETQHIDGGTLEMEPKLGATDIGKRVARAIYGGLNR